MVGLNDSDGAFQLPDQSVSLELTLCRPRVAEELTVLRE
jgi:hypothetical protein